MTPPPVADLPEPAPARLPAAGRAPTAAPAAAYSGLLLALVALAAGGIAIRDTAVTLGWVSGTRWIDAVVTSLNGLRFQWPMIPIGVVAVIAGAWMVSAALRPRRKTATAVRAETSIWMSPRDVARLASYAANTVPGVTGARSKATRRKVVVTADLADAKTGARTMNDVAAAVHGAIDILATRPRIIVHIGTGGAR